MQKITVEIVSRGFDGLTAENIRNALGHYFGEGVPGLDFTFVVKEVKPSSVPLRHKHEEDWTVPDEVGLTIEQVLNLFETDPQEGYRKAAQVLRDAFEPKDLRELRALAHAKGYAIEYAGIYCDTATLYPFAAERYGSPSYSISMFCVADGLRALEAIIKTL